jgi:N-acetylmuramoyl-L-alanine amidase
VISTDYDSPATGTISAAKAFLLLAAVAACVCAASAHAQPSVSQAGTAAKTADLSLQILDPRGETSSTTRETANILGRTSPEATVTVGGETARVFSTGIFVRDNVPLHFGENRIAVVATGHTGQKLDRVVTLTRTPAAEAPAEPKERRLEIDETTLQPAQTVFLALGDILELSFRGTPGQIAEYSLAPDVWRPMAEAVGEASGKPSGLYRASFVATGSFASTNSPVRFRLRAKDPEAGAVKVDGEQVIEAAGKAMVGFWDEGALRLVRVTDGGAAMSYGRHEVRLGGPYLAELNRGTVLRVTGMRGDNYHVRLSPDSDGWVDRSDVEWATAGTPLPHLAFTDVSAYGSEGADFVTIPYDSPVPFAVTPTVSPAGRSAIEIDFYGAHNALTWISHRPTAKVVREVTVKQMGTDHLRLSVELKGKQLWGFRWNVTNNAVVLTVRRPPRLAPLPDSVFKGLTIALEPGHGGNNSGARGVSGSQEKDVNRLAVQELARQFEAAGAKVTVVRENDESISLADRVRRGISANADLWISVHANSAGHQRGYLSVSGTSTYYKWLFARDLAEAIHARLLDITKLGDFGNVGNFNYHPLRANTWMPAMLVEQAFMSNPEDEAKMLDPAFRKDMMRAVVLGTEDWLNRMRAEAGEL